MQTEAHDDQVQSNKTEQQNYLSAPMYERKIHFFSKLLPSYDFLVSTLTLSHQVSQVAFLLLRVCHPPSGPPVFSKNQRETRQFDLYYLCCLLAACAPLHLPPHHVIRYLLIKWIP